MNTLQRTAMITDRLRRAVIAHRLHSVLTNDHAIASDDQRWITTKKGEKGGGGRRFFIDTETGTILKGGPKRMRGKTFAQAFESKQQKKERYAAARAAKKEQYAEKRKKTNAQGRKIVQKLIDKKYLAPSKAAKELKKNLTQRDVKRLTEIYKDGQRFVKNQKRRDKRRAEKEKSMGLLRQIEGL